MIPGSKGQVFHTCMNTLLWDPKYIFILLSTFLSIIGRFYMIRKLVKSSLTIALSLSIALSPNTVAFANTQAVYAQSQLANETTAIETKTKANKYADAELIAEEAANALVSMYGVTSLQYALISNGEIILSGQAGVYSKETKTLPTDTNMYGIGSVSKTFTAVAIMQLVEQGKVNLDDPVVKYIPEFKMKDVRYKDITVRMLLNHSSGLMGTTSINANLFYGDYVSPYDNLLNALENASLKADPGEFSVYCNDGFTLAELVVQNVSGMSFSSYIQKYISGPLALGQTKTPADKFDSNQLVKGYFPGIEAEMPREAISLIGAGGIYSTAKDLCNFAQIFMNKTNTNVLSKTSVKTMANSEYKNGLWPEEEYSARSYGLGFDNVDMHTFEQYGIEALAKGGDTSFYHSSLVILPDKNMAMAVTSSGGSSIFTELMAEKVLLSVLKADGAIDNITPDKTSTSPVAVSMPSGLKNYEGYYSNYGATYKITISEEGVLTLTTVPGTAATTQTFIYTGDNKFYTNDGSTYLSFVEESNGITYLYNNGYSTLPVLGQFHDSGYIAQKISSNPLAPEVKEAWETREGKNYFLCNESAYNSAVYVGEIPSYRVSLSKEMEGYLDNAAITSKNSAQPLLQIPDIGGRDLALINFYFADTTEYLNINGMVLISEDSIKALPTTSKFTCKITGGAYSHWYKISDKSANKTIKIKKPQNASFAVYDAKGSCVNYSYLTDNNSVVLPENGYVVFIGAASTQFNISYIK